MTDGEEKGPNSEQLEDYYQKIINQPNPGLASKLFYKIIGDEELNAPFLEYLKKRGDISQRKKIIPRIFSLLCRRNNYLVKSLSPQLLSQFRDFIIYFLEFNYYLIELPEDFDTEFISYSLLDKIRELVSRNDLRRIYKISRRNLFRYMKKTHLISLFSADEVNLIRFIVENIEDMEKYDEWENSGLFFGINLDEELKEKIRGAIMSLLPNYAFHDLYDPFFMMELFDFLARDDINTLIEDPSFDYIQLLCSQIGAFYPQSHGRDVVRHSLFYAGKNFKEIILPKLQNRDIRTYLRVVDYGLLGLLKSNEFYELLNDPNLNVLENILDAMYKLAEGKVSYNYYLLNRWSIFPDELLEKEKKFIKEIIKDIFKKTNTRLFVPIYALGFSRYFNEQEIYEMTIQDQINLIKLVLQSEAEHNFILYELAPEDSDVHEEFLSIVKRMIRGEELYRIMETLRGIEISPLIETGILEKLDYEDLINIFQDIEDMKVFMRSISTVADSWYRLNHKYYDTFWPFLTEHYIGQNAEEFYNNIIEILGVGIFQCGFFQSLNLKKKVRFFETLQKENLADFISYIGQSYQNEEEGFLEEMHSLGARFSVELRNKLIQVLEIFLDNVNAPFFMKETYLEGFFLTKWYLFFEREEMAKVKSLLREDRDILISLFYGEGNVNMSSTYVFINYYIFINKTAPLALLHQFTPSMCKEFRKNAEHLLYHEICSSDEDFQRAAIDLIEFSKEKEDTKEEKRDEKREKTEEKNPPIPPNFTNVEEYFQIMMNEPDINISIKLFGEILVVDQLRGPFLTHILKVVKEKHDDIFKIANILLKFNGTYHYEVEEIMGDEYHLYRTILMELLDELFFYDFDMFYSALQRTSDLVLERLRDAVEREDIEEIHLMFSHYMFYDVLDDELRIIFDPQEINLVKCLLNNIDEIEQYEFFNEGLPIPELGADIIEMINESLMEILPSYEFHPNNEPLFKLKFYDYLTDENLAILLRHPEFDKSGFIRSYMDSSDSGVLGRERLEERLKSIGITLDGLSHPN